MHTAHCFHITQTSFYKEEKEPCSLTKHVWWRRITWRLLVITIFIQRVMCPCGRVGGHETPWAPGAAGLVLALRATDRSLASHLNLSRSQFLVVKVEGQTSRFLRFSYYYIYDLLRALESKGWVFQIGKTYLSLCQNVSLPEASGVFFCVAISTVSKNMALPIHQMMSSLWPSLLEEKRREQGKNDFA